MDHHVHRIARLGAGVLISERWYKTATLIFLADPECTALHGGSSAYKVAAVRLQAAPDDHDGRMVVQEDDGVVLIVRMDGGTGGTERGFARTANLDRHVPP